MVVANPLMHPCLLQGLRCLVFDCDGVLIDSLEANLRYYGMLRSGLGLPALTRAEAEYVHTRTHREAVLHIVPEPLRDRAWAMVRAFDSASLLPYLRRSDGVRQFLWWLRDAGFRLAVNTSRTDSMDQILGRMDLEGFFQPVVTSGQVSSPKPHPEGLHRIMDAHGVAPCEVAYIGDSAVDMAAAEAAGVRFWAYRDRRLRAEVHIESFWEIKAAMQRCYNRGAVPF